MCCAGLVVCLPHAPIPRPCGAPLSVPRSPPPTAAHICFATAILPHSLTCTLHAPHMHAALIPLHTSKLHTADLTMFLSLGTLNKPGCLATGSPGRGLATKPLLLGPCSNVCWADMHPSNTPGVLGKGLVTHGPREGCALLAACVLMGARLKRGALF